MSSLTSQQLKLIEENRLKALKRKQQKLSLSKPLISVGSSKPTVIQNTFQPTTYPKTKNLNQNNLEENSVQCSVVGEDRFVISCKYSPKLISIFKSIPSRQYDPSSKSWTFSLLDFKDLERKFKANDEILPIPNNAVLVKNKNKSCTAIHLNIDCSDTKSGNCYLINNARFEIDVPYDANCIGLFKSISSKLYNVNTRRWSFDLRDYKRLFNGLKEIHTVQVEPLSSTVLTVFKNQMNDCSVAENSVVNDCDLSKISNDLVMSLMPFQKEGVKFAISRNGRVLLADDMGLGKTVQSICIAAYYREYWPLLVICPSSVRLMWKEALLKWLPTYLSEDDISIINASRDVLSNCLVSIISYDLLTKLQKEFVEMQFQIAIADESHFIKNFKTARTKAVKAVVKRSKQLILLSGTPALSRPVELYTQISLLRPDLFPQFQQFGLRYCAGKQGPWGWEYTGSSNMEELRIILEETVMLRRTKEEVLSQLPPKVRLAVTIDVGSYKKSAKLKESFIKAHAAVEKKGLSGVEKHGALLQFFNESAQIKLPAVKSYVFDLLEGGHKFLLFAHHKILLDSLQNELEKKNYDYMRIDGATSSEKRQSEVEKFQERSSCKVALLSITAANMGINLHAASLVVFAELFWNPGILVQAEDRCYRIGQRDVVNIHYLVARGTSDDYIWEMVKKKLNVLSQAGLNKSNFDDTESHNASNRKQNDILNYFKKEEKLNENLSKCNISLSDEELHELFENDCLNFDDSNQLNDDHNATSKLKSDSTESSVSIKRSVKSQLDDKHQESDSIDNDLAKPSVSAAFSCASKRKRK